MAVVHNINRGSIIENNTSLTVIDPGDDAGNGAVSPTLSKIEEIVRTSNKPLKYAVITHGHGDHCANYFVLKRLYKGLELITHENCKIPAKHKLKKRTSFSISGTSYDLIPTPGHCEQGDDIAIYLPTERFLFVGDTAQPHGQSYEQCDSFTCTPAYSDGQKFIDGITLLLSLPFTSMQTGHGWQLNEYGARKSLEITRQVVERTRDLSQRLAAENRNQPNRVICEWVYRTIAYERGLAGHIVEDRITKRAPLSDFVNNDRPGILYWVKRFR
ncbi:MBL fold metallo-hydrolase [Candidatus Woesearchaeota archaeon]|nr:MBL fold metallo-hydrolase [Candidatus Woesearchaeota archaeon]